MNPRRPTRPKLRGTNAIGLTLVLAAAVSLAAHPRATLPVVVLDIVLRAARLPRFATCLLAVLLVATLLSARVDTASQAIPRTPPAIR